MAAASSADLLTHPGLHALAATAAGDAARLGLTNFRTRADVYHNAIAPAAALFDALPTGPVGSWAEVGCGSGLLGIALAILSPGCHVTLIDRRQRAAAYADVLTHVHGISNAAPLEADAHMLTPQSYVGVVLRAVAPASDSLTIGLRLARTYVAAYHSHAAEGYSEPPDALRTLHCVPTCEQDLMLSLYART